jgi:hypothetical protein
MIKINITNFRGCDRVVCECAPIALIAGLNGAGKTSIAQAVGAALNGNAIPISGLGRSPNLGVFVRAGAAVADVTVATESGTVSLQWPEGSTLTSGRAPGASEYATGLQSIAPPMPAKDRLRVLADYLHAEPTREDLTDALAQFDLAHEVVINAIWDLIQRDGWDGAYESRRNKGAELKGQWRQVTGANYGSRIAAQWRPDLAELNERDLLDALRRAENDRDHAIAAAAVSADERRRLEQEAGEHDARREAYDAAGQAVELAERTYTDAREARQRLPPSEMPRTYACPYCDQPIVIVHDLTEMHLETAEDYDDDANKAGLKERRMAIATADGQLAHASDALNTARRQLAAADAALTASSEAREKLAKWPRAVETGTDLETAKQALARAEKRLAEWRAKITADELHAKIESNDIVLDILGGDGLRAKKLERVIGTFVDTQLAALTKAAKWSPVRLGADGSVAYAGRPYALLSSSEQYRIRAVLAVAMGKIEGADLVILDGADILDAPSRSGLFSMLDSAGLPALVCLTLPRPEQMPDLAAYEMGHSYWLAGGVIEPVDARVAA